MIKEMIDCYHRQKLLPVFNLRAHATILNEHIAEFKESGLPALERFAKENGYRVVEEDFGFRYRFIPQSEPEDCEQWKKEGVPVNRA